MLGAHSSAARSTISIKWGMDSTPSKLMPIISSPVSCSSPPARVVVALGFGIGIGRDARSLRGAPGSSGIASIGAGVRGVRGLRGGRTGAGPPDEEDVEAEGVVQTGAGTGALGREIVYPWLCLRRSSRIRDQRSLSEVRPSPVKMVRRREHDGGE